MAPAAQSRADADASTGPSASEVLRQAMQRGFGGGVAGASAMAVQVGTLMWLRTTMNYQYRHGTSTTVALKTLWKQGGVPRFYRGLLPALLQGPLSRFGDTAANVGVLAALNSFENTKDMSVGLKTSAASFSAGLWRIFLMPIDATKTILQVEGQHGISLLGKKLRAGGPAVLYHGSLAAAAATMVGHFPWFFTYNFLDERLPQPNSKKEKLLRSAFMGFSSSIVSDTVSNSVRVIKTTKQTHHDPISYPEAVREVVAKDGVIGLFGRGLKTRILVNGLQGLLFSILWKMFDEKMNKKT